MKCFEKFSELDQIEILKRGGDFQSKDKQDLFYQSLIEAHPIKTRRSRLKPNLAQCENKEFTRPKHSVEHGSSYTFHVMFGEKRIKVCKTAYLGLYALGDKKVRILKALLLKGKSPKDLRGKQMNRKTFPQHHIQQIKDHIQSFPLKTSHYSSK